MSINFNNTEQSEAFNKNALAKSFRISSLDFLYDVDKYITSDIYLKYQNLFIKYYSLFLDSNRPLNSGILFSIIAYPYEFINPKNFSFRKISFETKFLDVTNNNSGKIRIIKIDDFSAIDPPVDIKSIMKYRPMNSSFFGIWEVLHNFDIIQDHQSILELCSFPTFSEPAKYYSLKYKKKDCKFYSIILPKYAGRDSNNNSIKKFIDYYFQYLDICQHL